jgi:general secretion pathway protein J
MTPTRTPTAGLTLVEVLVALAVFAVIGSAAFALLDQTLRSQRLADARLERLVQEQRTMRILALDTMQAVAGSVRHAPSGISFLRRGGLSQGNGPVTDGLVVRYGLNGQGFFREIGAVGAEPATQLLLPDVSRATWQLVKAGTDLPPDAPTAGVEGIELVLDLPGNQHLRGLFQVPSDRLTSP